MAALPPYLCRCSTSGSRCDYEASGGCSHHEDISRNHWKIPLYSNSAAKQALEDWQEKEAKRVAHMLEVEKFVQSFVAALSAEDDEPMEEVIEVSDSPDDPNLRRRGGIWRFEDKSGKCCLPVHDGRRRLLRQAFAQLG